MLNPVAMRAQFYRPASKMLINEAPRFLTMLYVDVRFVSEANIYV